MFSGCSKETISMWTRDRIRLDADVYRPDAEGEFPILLMRQPYGRAIASTVVYAHPSWYAAQGYIVVIQDVRGRGTSEGKFRLFADEIEDGAETVNWAASLPGSNGQVGMYGFSYQGMTQLYAAAKKPAALKTICPSMIGYDLYADWAYEGGAFCYQLNLGWAIQLAAETARREGNIEAYQTLYQAGRNLPFTDPVCGRSPLLEKLAPDSFYHDWLAHPTPDDYWEALSPIQYMQEVDLPMLHIGGWFDTYMRGTMRLYREMASRSQYRQQLIVGAWSHLPWGRKVGAIDYGTEAASPIDRLQLQWFDHILKGKDWNESPVLLFETGTNQWRSFDSFPTPTHQTFLLSSNGLACIDDRAGTLTPTPQFPIPPPHTPIPDPLLHDPWRPIPALGGHATAPAGSFDRASLDCRTDVATYTSEPLTQDLYLVGEAIVELNCRADTPSFDLCVVLSEVKPNGSVFNLTQGYMRLNVEEHTNQSHKIVLQPICACIPAGSAIRLSVSLACFPAYVMNAGTGETASDAHLINAKVITILIQCGGDSPSQISLPVMS